MRTHGRETSFTALSLVLGLVVGLCLGEIMLRFLAPQPTGPHQFAWNPDLGPIPVPLQHGRRIVPGVYDYSYTNNALGFRGSRDYTSAKQPNVRRILFLGDSFTYGIGVNDDETFSSVVQRRLDASALKAEVINAGVPGTGTDYALSFFLKIGYTYRSDVVALFFFSNDFDDNSRHQYFILNSDGLPKSTVANPIKSAKWSRYVPEGYHFYDWLFSWSHLANLLKQAVVRWNMVQANNHNESFTGAISSPNVQRQPASLQGWDKTLVLLRNLRQAVERTGATFVIFYVPTEDEVGRMRASQPAALTEVFIANFCRTDHVRFYSITPILSASPYALASLYFREGHWTAVAHRVAGDFITQALQNIGGISGGQ